MNADLERLAGHQRELFRIAGSLESLCRSNGGQPFSRLLRVVAEMHDHQAELVSVLELSAPRMEVDGDAPDSGRVAAFP